MSIDDKAAEQESERIRNEFWVAFERALEPKRCSKKQYLEELEVLISDAQMRADCVRGEIEDEEGDEPS